MPKKQKTVQTQNHDLKENIFFDYTALKKTVKNHKKEGKKIVLTQGTFDLLHIGHVRYFERAKQHGDVLVIGVDSDTKVKARKGPERPVVPQEERMEMISYIKYVDYIVLKDLNHKKWELIKIIRPDVLIATKETYTEAQIQKLHKICGEVVVLDPMATTSTSAKIRKLQLGIATKLEKNLVPNLMRAVEQVFEEFKG